MTSGPAGCHASTLVASYTCPSTITQQLSRVLCRATSSYGMYRGASPLLPSPCGAGLSSAMGEA